MHRKGKVRYVHISWSATRCKERLSRSARAAEPQEATADALAMAMSPKYAEALKDGAARVALVWEGADWQGMGLDVLDLIDASSSDAFRLLVQTWFGINAVECQPVPAAIG